MSTVLVVDDDPSTRMVLRMILEKDGHEVVEAEHGEAALAHLPTLLPDIVTTDLTMPVLSGEDLIARLRSEPRTASIPIVVVSGNPAAARALHESGVVAAVVLKPFNPSELAECIRAIATRFTPMSTIA
jgi:two-component system, chemotaxis family, chemotaxis protein CheY